MPTFHYTVDDEPQETTAHTLTPAQILGNAHIDAASHYLVQLQGNHRTSYEGKPDETIHMHENMKFISVSVAPTPVSSAVARADFIEQLRAMGFAPEDEGAGKIAVPYAVETGKFAGREIKIGFVVADDYNLNPPSCVHVCPPLLPLHPGNDLPHPAGGVHGNQSFDAGWQYWSRPIRHWQQTQRTARDVMTHVRRLFDTQ